MIHRPRSKALESLFSPRYLSVSLSIRFITSKNPLRSLHARGSDRTHRASKTHTFEWSAPCSVALASVHVATSAAPPTRRRWAAAASMTRTSAAMALDRTFLGASLGSDLDRVTVACRKPGLLVCLSLYCMLHVGRESDMRYTASGGLERKRACSSIEGSFCCTERREARSQEVY